MSNTCRRITATSVAPVRPSPHPPQRSGTCRTTTSGSATCSSVVPGCPAGRPGPRPDLPRNERGAGLTRPSDDGGFDGFFDDIPSRASSSAIRASACSNRAANCRFNASSCSYDGCGESAGTNYQRAPTASGNWKINDSTYPATLRSEITSLNHHRPADPSRTGWYDASASVAHSLRVNSSACFSDRLLATTLGVFVSNRSASVRDIFMESASASTVFVPRRDETTTR
jgi:hypothetical protein